MTIVFIYFRFCPSVFFYLCTVIPSVWFLELDLAERRSKFNVTQAFSLISAPQGNLHFDTDDTLPVKISYFYCLFIISSFSELACSMENSS